MCSLGRSVDVDDAATLKTDVSSRGGKIVGVLHDFISSFGCCSSAHGFGVIDGGGRTGAPMGIGGVDAVSLLMRILLKLESNSVRPSSCS